MQFSSRQIQAKTGLRVTRDVAFILLNLFIFFNEANATVVPGAADVGRIAPPLRKPAFDHSRDSEVTTPALLPSAQVPEAAKTIHFTLKKIKIEGASAFSEERLSSAYASYIGKDISLDAVWGVASTITARYQDAGYLLSRAYVPEQRIRNGTVIIKIVEGYVGKVELNDPISGRLAVKGLIARLQEKRPITASEMESFLLRINDLPGVSFRAVLSSAEDAVADEAAVKLTLLPSKKENKGSITFDNSGSRFLGPNETSASYQASLLPLQQTSVSALSSLPAKELKYASLSHAVALAPNVTMELEGNVTKARPGYTLERFDINSQSLSAGAGLHYQWIRQRKENLALKFTVSGKNTTSDLTAHTPLTRDRIRTLRAGVSYDFTDKHGGYNVVNTAVTQGVDGFGSSKKGARNLSRAEASPDFTKVTVQASRQQSITEDWSVLASASGQLASGPLYSSEEFGYGGQTFGRAYDASEMTGDRGVSGALEVQYNKWSEWKPVGLTPYGFYDVGKVWNEDAGQAKSAAGSSTGFGVRFAAPARLSGNLGLAFPLVRDISTPIYGGGKNGPRVLLQFSKEF